MTLPCCCSVMKSCLTLCNPMDCSTPGLAAPHYLPVSPSSCPLNQWCYPIISSSVTLFCLQSFPTLGSFPVSQHFASGGQSIGASASASVLPMNTQDWFPLGWTGFISLLSKGLQQAYQTVSLTTEQHCILFPPLTIGNHCVLFHYYVRPKCAFWTRQFPDLQTLPIWTICPLLLNLIFYIGVLCAYLGMHKSCWPG